MKSFLRYGILLLVLLGLQITNVRAVTKSWVGGATGDPSNWSNPNNWSPAVTAPAPTDDVSIGSVLLFVNPPVVNAGDNVSCASITFGAVATLTTIPLTVNGTLNVGGSVTLLPTLLIAFTVPLSGTGTLNCASISVGTNTNTLSSLLNLTVKLSLVSTLANLNVSGNVTVNSNSFLILGDIDGVFSLVSGTTKIGGQILTQNTAFLITLVVGNPTFSIDAADGSTATLILTNAAPIKTTAVSGSTYAGSIDFYNSTGTGQATVNYAYADAGIQTVYATTGVSNLNTIPALYQNLTFTGTGNKRPTASGTLLTVAGNIDNSAGSPIDFVTNTNTVRLTGTTQSIAGGAYVSAPTTGTVFYNLYSSAASVTLSGRNNIAAKGALAFYKNVGTTMNVNATAPNSLTLLSNSTGDASIASLSSDVITPANALSATVTGTINVQRYVKGGSSLAGSGRRYMLISSPVANVSASTYNLQPFFVNTYITGPGGTGGGFDNSPTNNPSVYIYDENAPGSPSPTAIIGAEFKGFNTMNETVPMGNGIEFYFRGSRAITSPAVFLSPFPAPDNATLNFSGAVYKGAGTNGDFTASIINFVGSPPNYYSSTSSSVTVSNNLSFASTVSTKKGLNLIGNPYPSVIDLQKVYSVNSNKYRYYYMLVRNASTGTNSSSTKFAIYDASAGTTQAGASRYALSGQGFFIIAPDAASTLTFNETMKAPYSSYTGAPSTIPVFNVVRNPSVVAKVLSLSPDKNDMQQTAAVASTAAETTTTDPMPRLRLEMMRDTTILNTADIAFDKSASAKFVPGEDAPYIAASGQGDYFYSQSADSAGCFANYTANLEKLKRVNLFTAFSNYGQYKITSPIKSNIDERYTIFLKDKYTSDSLDVVHNPVYTFNVDQNAASYAGDRFYLSIGIAPGHEYKLLGFSGNKVTSGIQLTWKTDNESNFTGFVVEKSINGGKSFVMIDSLQSTGAGSYTFTDPAPGTGQITYRLAQSLVTGDTQLSKNLVFDYSSDLNILKFMVYPTSTAQDIHIKLGKTYSNNIKINIISATGGMVKTLTSVNTDSIQENVGNLIKGLYIVEAIDTTTGKRIGSAKFFKQ